MKAKFVRYILPSVSAIVLLISCVLSGAFTRTMAAPEPSNILLSKTGAKVAAPESDYSMYTRYGMFNSEKTSSAVAKLTDGTTGINKAGASKLQYLNTTTLKIGVMYELGGLYDISGAKLYLPNDAVAGTDLLRGVEVYAGTDPTTLCKPENRIGSVAGNSEKIITISADTPRQAQYAVVLFTDYGGENNVYVSEIELYGIQSSEQVSGVNRNLARGLTPEIKLTGQELTPLANGTTSGIAGFTDGLFPDTFTQIYGDQGGGGQYSTHVVWFDLGGVYDISRVHVPYYLSDGAAALLSSWDVYLSDSNDNLLTAGNRIAGKTASQLRVMTAEFIPKSARYAAIVLQAPENAYITKVFEIEIYGVSGNQSPEPPSPPGLSDTPSLIDGMTGHKVLVSADDYSLFSRYIWSGSDITPQGMTDQTLENVSTLYGDSVYKDTHKTGVLFELPSLCSVTGAEVYLPASHAAREIRVYAGTDMGDLGTAGTLIEAVTATADDTKITLAANSVISAKYVMFLFSQTPDSNRTIKIAELKVLGSSDSGQAPEVKRNIAGGVTPSLYFAIGGDLSKLAECGSSQVSSVGKATYTDGLYPNTPTEMWANAEGNSHIIALRLDRIYAVSQVNMIYNLWNDIPATWDIYLSEYETDLFAPENKVTGKTAADGITLCVRFPSRTARYIAIAVTPASGRTTKIYEVEALGINAESNGIPPKSGPALPAYDPDSDIELDIPDMGEADEDGFVRTPNHQSSVIHTLQPILVGVASTSDYNAAWVASHTADAYTMLTDGIIGDSTGKSQRIEFWGYKAAEGYKAVIIFDMKKYYNLNTVSVYSNHSKDVNNVIKGWDVYAAPTRKELIENADSLKTAGKQGYSDTLDKTVEVDYTEVRFLMFVLEPDDKVNGALRIPEIEAFGELSDNQPAEEDETEQRDQFIDIVDESTGMMVRVHFINEFDAFNFVVQLDSGIYIDEEKQALFADGLGNMYFVYDLIRLSLVDMFGDDIDIGGRKMTVYCPVPQSLNSSEINIAYRSSYGDIELLDTVIENERLVFDTCEINEYAFVKANITNAGYDGTGQVETGASHPPLKALLFVTAPAAFALTVICRKKRRQCQKPHSGV